MFPALRKLQSGASLPLVSHEEGNPAGLSSCSGGLRPLVELCVEPAGLCGRCTGVAVPLRAAAPVGVFSRGTTRISGSLSCGAREVRPPCVWPGRSRQCSRVMGGQPEGKIGLPRANPRVRQEHFCQRTVIWERGPLCTSNSQGVRLGYPLEVCMGSVQDPCFPRKHPVLLDLLAHKACEAV